MVEGPGDSIWVLDWTTGRFSVFDPDLRYARSFKTPRADVQNMHVLSDGRIAMGAHVGTPERIGYPLQVVEADGRVSRSFGAVKPSFRRDRHEDVLRLTTLESDSLIWSADVNQYRLQLWSLDGSLVREIRREVNWFEPWSTQVAREDRERVPPVPRTIAIQRDSAGLLWILIRVAGRDWKSALVSSKDPYGRPMLGIGDKNVYHDTIVEVIDPRTNQLLASTRVEGWLCMMAGDRLAAQYWEDEEGYPHLRVWQFNLTAKGGNTP
jgi:hypothetical protein